MVNFGCYISKNLQISESKFFIIKLLIPWMKFQKIDTAQNIVFYLFRLTLQRVEYNCYFFSSLFNLSTQIVIPFLNLFMAIITNMKISLSTFKHTKKCTTWRMQTEQFIECVILILLLRIHKIYHEFSDKCVFKCMLCTQIYYQTTSNVWIN